MRILRGTVGILRVPRVTVGIGRVLHSTVGVLRILRGTVGILRVLRGTVGVLRILRDTVGVLRVLRVTVGVLRIRRGGVRMLCAGRGTVSTVSGLRVGRGGAGFALRHFCKLPVERFVTALLNKHDIPCINARGSGGGAQHHARGRGREPRRKGHGGAYGDGAQKIRQHGDHTDPAQVEQLHTEHHREHRGQPDQDARERGAFLVIRQQPFAEFLYRFGRNGTGDLLKLFHEFIQVVRIGGKRVGDLDIRAAGGLDRGEQIGGAGTVGAGDPYRIQPDVLLLEHIDEVVVDLPLAVGQQNDRPGAFGAVLRSKAVVGGPDGKVQVAAAGKAVIRLQHFFDRLLSGAVHNGHIHKITDLARKQARRQIAVVRNAVHERVGDVAQRFKIRHQRTGIVHHHNDIAAVVPLFGLADLIGIVGISVLRRKTGGKAQQQHNNDGHGEYRRHLYRKVPAQRRCGADRDIAHKRRHGKHRAYSQRACQRGLGRRFTQQEEHTGKSGKAQQKGGCRADDV